MPWIKLSLFTDQHQAEAITEALEECGAASVSLQDGSDQPVFETLWEKTPLWSRVNVMALFPVGTNTDDILSRVREQLGLTDTPPHIIDLLGDEDWANSWKAQYNPLNVGHRLWIVPSWCTPPDPTAVNIVLDPGMAFGTGNHPTTALCLDFLSGHPLSGQVVLDYGCGSGILSIAAIKLGARAAFAVDIDPQALEVSQRNAELNGIHEGMIVSTPDKLPADLRANVVLANILSGTLMELVDEITSRVRPYGWLVLSGLLGEDQAHEVRRRYDPPFALTPRENQNWFMLAGTKPVEVD